MGQINGNENGQMTVSFQNKKFNSEDKIEIKHILSEMCSQIEYIVIYIYAKVTMQEKCKIWN